MEEAVQVLVLEVTVGDTLLVSGGVIPTRRLGVVWMIEPLNRIWM